jgi:ADP-ribose pyrophosphatase YjhB (NUDIX family)
MTIHSCPDNCCKINVNPYEKDDFMFQKPRRIRRKAGVFIYDQKQQKVLLVQSRGKFWGCPKGTVNFGETERAGAIRELREETGINMLESTLDDNHMLKIRNNAVYYYIEMDECEIKPLEQVDDNDVNGFAWINVNCLQKIIDNGNISLNNHMIILIRKFLKKNLVQNNFTEIKITHKK